MSDLTITAIDSTLLRVPWPQTPWLKGHAFGDARNLLVLDVETRGGIVGMGYLFLWIGAREVRLSQMMSMP